MNPFVCLLLNITFLAGMACGAPPSAPTSAPSEFHILAARYRLCIAELASERDERVAAEYADSLRIIGEKAVDIEINSTAILMKLRSGAAKNKDGRLDIIEIEPVSVYPYVVGSSPASAQLVSTLRQEGFVREYFNIAGVLISSPANLCPQWQQLVESELKIDRSPKFVRIATELLYTKGSNRDHYRDALLAYVDGDEPLEPLLDILFIRDPVTGLVHPDHTKANDGVAKKYIAPGQPLQLRIACARYLLESGDRDIAERTVFDVLQHDYFRLVHSQEPYRKERQDEDFELFHARDEALSLLFYEIKSDRAFEYIYRRWLDVTETRSDRTNLDFDRLEDMVFFIREAEKAATTQATPSF